MYDSKKLANHPYSQCVIHNYPDGGKWFISYRTPVVFISPDGWLSATHLACCSATTRTQVGWFLRECGGKANYYTVKEIHGTGREFNIWTGEYREG